MHYKRGTLNLNLYLNLEISMKLKSIFAAGLLCATLSAHAETKGRMSCEDATEVQGVPQMDILSSKTAAIKSPSKLLAADLRELKICPSKAVEESENSVIVPFEISTFYKFEAAFATLRPSGTLYSAGVLRLTLQGGMVIKAEILSSEDKGIGDALAFTTAGLEEKDVQKASVARLDEEFETNTAATSAVYRVTIEALQKKTGSNSSDLLNLLRVKNGTPSSSSAQAE